MGHAVVCLVAEFAVHARVVPHLVVDDFYSFFIYDIDFGRAVVRVWIEPRDGDSNL